jgi:uncharacterized protein
MKLRVDDITAESRELTFAEPERDLNRILGSGPIHEYQLQGPVRVELSYYRAGTEVFIEGSVEATSSANCARCAEQFQMPTRRSFRYVLAPKAIDYDGADDDRGEDLEFSQYTGDEVDLSPFVREQVLLALSVRPLCAEDCRGLCPRCGANLNQTACGCSTVAPDPRLTVLRGLKVGHAR